MSFFFQHPRGAQGCQVRLIAPLRASIFWNSSASRVLGGRPVSLHQTITAALLPPSGPHQGQNCGAGSRTYVHAAIYDEFVEKSVAAAKSK